MNGDGGNAKAADSAWDDDAGREWESKARQNLAELRTQIDEAKNEEKYGAAKKLKKAYDKAEDRIRTKADMTEKLGKLLQEKEDAIAADEFSAAEKIAKKIIAARNKRDRFLAVVPGGQRSTKSIFGKFTGFFKRKPKQADSSTSAKETKQITQTDSTDAVKGTAQPANQSVVNPTVQPSTEPKKEPTTQPTTQPATQPTTQPATQAVDTKDPKADTKAQDDAETTTAGPAPEPANAGRAKAPEKKGDLSLMDSLDESISLDDSISEEKKGAEATASPAPSTTGPVSAQKTGVKVTGASENSANAKPMPEKPEAKTTPLFIPGAPSQGADSVKSGKAKAASPTKNVDAASEADSNTQPAAGGVFLPGVRAAPADSKGLSDQAGGKTATQAAETPAAQDVDPMSTAAFFLPGMSGAGEGDIKNDDDDTKAVGAGAAPSPRRPDAKAGAPRPAGLAAASDSARTSGGRYANMEDDDEGDLDDTDQGPEAEGDSDDEDLQIEELSEEELRQLRILFDRYDSDKSGTMEDNEILHALEMIGYSYSYDYNDHFLEMFCEMVKEGPKGNFHLDFNEFTTFMLMYKAYSAKNMRKFTTELTKAGIQPTETIIKELMQRVDLEDDPATEEHDPRPMYGRVIAYIKAYDVRDDGGPAGPTPDGKATGGGDQPAGPDGGDADDDQGIRQRRMVFVAGERVLCNFRGRGKWHRGRIARVNPGRNTYLVRYDDGGLEDNVTPENLEELDEEPQDSPVQREKEDEKRPASSAARPEEAVEGKTPDAKSPAVPLGESEAKFKRDSEGAEPFPTDPVEVARQLEQLERSELREVFELILDRYDVDGNRTLGLEEFRVATRAMGLDPSEGSIEDLFAQADKDGDGELGFDEFCRYAQEVMTEHMTKNLEINTVRTIIKAYNGDKGFFTMAELKSGIMELGLSPEVAGSLATIADKDGDGTIDEHEFLEMLTSGTRESNAIMRRLVSCVMPSPSSYLLNVEDMPTTYRLSALKRFEAGNSCHLSSRLHPRLASDGLSWSQFALDPKADLEGGRGPLQPIPLPEAAVDPLERKRAVADDDLLAAQFELVSAVGIPLPDSKASRGRIAARRVRACILQDNKPQSNIHMAKARWREKAEDEWLFTPRGGSNSDDFWGTFVLRTPRASATLLIELAVLVRIRGTGPAAGDQATVSDPRLDALVGAGAKSMGRTTRSALGGSGNGNVSESEFFEMACGFAKIKLDRDTCGRRRVIEAKLEGGTFLSSSQIKREEIYARRYGFQKLLKILRQKPVTPLLRVRVTPPSALPYKLRTLLPSLPLDVITTSKCLSLVRMYRELAADCFLAQAQPLQFAKSQDVALRLLVTAFDMPDAMQVLAEVWDEELRKLPSRDRTDTKQGSASQPAKALFRKVVRRMLPVLSLLQFPSLIVGITDARRKAMLRKLIASDPVELLVKDGVGRPAPQRAAAQRLLGQNIFRPLDPNKLMYCLDGDSMLSSPR